MVAKLPVDGETSTCSGMAWGFNPLPDERRPVHVGARMAVIESVTKLVASGFWYEDAFYLTFQEYFERLGSKPRNAGASRWPLCWVHWMPRLVSGIGSIGGKDSMSGSFRKAGCAPTLVSFATAIGKANKRGLHRIQEAGEHRGAHPAHSGPRDRLPQLSSP